MNVEQKAASEALKFLNGVAALVEVRPLLNNIGNSKQALADLQSKIGDGRAELEQTRQELADIRETLKQTTLDAKTAGSRIVAEYEAKAAAILKDAEAEIDRLVAERFRQELDAKDTQITELQSKLASFKNAVEGI